MVFRILGPVEAWSGDGVVKLGAPKERALLAILLLHAGEVVSTDRLVDELWGEDAPDRAFKAVQVYVSRLRRALAPVGAAHGGVIMTAPGGYTIALEREQLDLHRFERLASEGRRALDHGDAPAAAAKLREALALWRGAPLSDVAHAPFADAEIARLEEIRLAALEDRIEADLEAGRAGELVGELEAIAARNPLRERPRGHLMLALYRSGRQAEALDVYRQTRATLVEQLGIEPGHYLRELEQAILRQDTALMKPVRGGEVSTAPAATAVKNTPGGTFVGREPELGELVHALERAVGGAGGVVLLPGEPGIGKTRLMEELARVARDRGVHVVSARCWEAGGAPAYWPWVQLVRGCVRDLERDVLRSRLSDGAPEVAELVPVLRERLPDLPRPPALTPDAARFRLFDAVASFFVRTAEAHPLVLLLDDLHAADEPSLQLLRYLAGQLTAVPVLVLAAYRDTEDGPLDGLLAQLAREPVTLGLCLEGLSAAEVGRLVELSSGRASERAAAEIHTRTDGNPLFVVELVRLLRSEGDLDRLEADGAARLIVPDGVRELISRRVDAVSDVARSVLSVASVLGHEFDVETLERLPELRDRPVLCALDEAVAVRLLAEGAGGPGRLRFAHALIRDAVYEALSPGRRIQLHRMVGEALERRYRDDPEPHLAELAHHFFQAAQQRDVEKASRYAESAGRRAAGLLAHEQAAAHFEHALTCLAWGGGIGDERRRWRLLQAVGEARLHAGDRVPAIEAFEGAAEVARALRAPELLAETALARGGAPMWADAMLPDEALVDLLDEALAALGEREPPLRARLLSRLARELFLREPQRGAEVSRQAVALARESADGAAIAFALCTNVLPWDSSTAVERLAAADEILRRADESREPELALEGRIGRVGSLVQLGDMGAVEREIDAYERAAVALRQPAYQSWVAAWRAMVASLRGRFDEAERLAEEAFALAERGGSPNALTNYGGLLFQLRWMQGRLDELEEATDDIVEQYAGYIAWRCARVTLRAALGQADRARRELEELAADDFAALIPSADGQVGAICLADACASLRDDRFAGALYERLRPQAHMVASAAGGVVCLGSVACYVAELAVLGGRLDDAAVHFERAIDRNDAIGAVGYAAEARCNYAAMLAARRGSGDREKGLKLVEEARAVAERIGMGHVLAKLPAVEASLGVDAPPGASVPAAVTR